MMNISSSDEMQRRKYSSGVCFLHPHLNPAAACFQFELQSLKTVTELFGLQNLWAYYVYYYVD